ncbi:MAG: triple tyrosine motif-containing protein [Balneolaceae bacterium]
MFSFNNEVYLGNVSGLQKWSNEGLQDLKVGDKVFPDTLVYVVPISESRILLGFKNSHPQWFDGKSLLPFNLEKGDRLLNKYPYDAIRVNDSTIAIAAVYGGVFFYNLEGKLLKIFNENSGAKTTGVYDLFLDHESSLWLGTSEYIQKLMINNPVLKYGEESGIDDYVSKITRNGETLLFSRFDGNIHYSFMSQENTIEFREFTNRGEIYQWGDSTIIYNSKTSNISNFSGSKILESDLYLTFENFDEPMVFSFLSNSGIVHKKDKSMKRILVDSNLNLKSFSQGIIIDGNYYLLNSNIGLYKLAGDSLKSIDFNKSSSRNIRYNNLTVINNNIFVSIEGSVGKSGISGIYKYNLKTDSLEKSEFFGRLDSEFVENQVTVMKQCPNGDIWFQNAYKIKRVYQQEGTWKVKSAPYNLIGEGSAIYSIICDGENVWFGGVNGLYQLTNPDWDYKTDFKTNITGIYVNNDSLIYGGFGEPVKDIVLPYEDNELRFTYAAASYIDPERNTYSYKLEGFDRDWSEWSLETQKDYTNIPEGDYVFKIRSRNVYEVDGRDDQISFSVLPPWYRTWWAYVLYLILVTVVFYSIYKVRVNQLLKVERMRTKIASDLHDEVSATLTGISYFAEAVRRDKNKAKREHFISLITESAGDAKEKITDIVWSINPDNDDWGMFLSKCRRYASDLLESKDIKYELKIADKIPGKLPMEIRQHLWMIYKEMLTNAVRHSNASRLDVIMDVDGRYLKLIVQDDGQGFDSENQNGGNGVFNIKRRAEAINATLEIDSESGFGTRWRLVLPL